MDNAIYTNLARQSGLLKELRVIANNMANANTTGFKREGAIFTEHIMAAGAGTFVDPMRHSLSMGNLGAHYSQLTPGAMRMTGGHS